MTHHLNSACIFFLALTSIIYAKKGYDEEAIRRGDAYIDKLLEEISQNRVEEYDPYVIEDSVVGFHKKVVFVNVSGEAKFHDGYIKGLSTLHRVEHCSLQESRGRLKVNAELGAGELEFHYSGSVKFMNFGPTVTVQGTLAYVQVHMEFTVDSETGKNGKLDNFVIDDMRGMKVWVTGLGPLNWAVNPIVKGVTKIFKRFVRNFMENKVEKHIAQRIPNFEFPVEGGEETVPTEPETNPPTEPETVPTQPETNPTEPETVPTEPETVPETNPPTEPETNPKEPETVPTEPEANPPTETVPETNPKEPETVPTEPETVPETNPPTEPEANPTESETVPTEPEANPPTETVPTETETNPPREPDTVPTDPEAKPPTEPDAVPTDPETNPPTESDTVPSEPETEPEETGSVEQEKNLPVINEPEPDASEEVARLEPDRESRDSESDSPDESSDASEERLDVSGFQDDKYLSFVDE